MFSAMSKLAFSAVLSSVLLFGVGTLQPVKASSCNVSIFCESLGNGGYFCEAYPGNAGTYSWSSSGVLGSGHGPFQHVSCYYGTMNVSVTYTDTNGCTSTASRTLYCGRGSTHPY